jgi:hypothetical protein
LPDSLTKLANHLVLSDRQIFLFFLSPGSYLRGKHHPDYVGQKRMVNED